MPLSIVRYRNCGCGRRARIYALRYAESRAEIAEPEAANHPIRSIATDPADEDDADLGAVADAPKRAGPMGNATGRVDATT
jgi:hypothetical protein